jgi:hypothetical protein
VNMAKLVVAQCSVCREAWHAPNCSALHVFSGAIEHRCHQLAIATSKRQPFLIDPHRSKFDRFESNTSRRQDSRTGGVYFGVRLRTGMRVERNLLFFHAMPNAHQRRVTSTCVLSCRDMLWAVVFTSDRMANTWLVHVNQRSDAARSKQNREGWWDNAVVGLVGKPCRLGWDGQRAW